MSGCSLECWKDVVQKACCPGYWGSQCYGMEVGGPNPAPHAHACQHAPSSGSFNAQLGHLTLAAPKGGTMSGAAQSCWAWANQGSMGQT